MSSRASSRRASGARATAALAAWLLVAPALAEAPAAAAARPIERCGATPAPGSRCADVRGALGGLEVGARLGGCRVSEIAVLADRILISLSGDGGAVVGVEVVRPDPGAPPPPAATPSLDLYLRSDTPGSPTPAWQLVAVTALAEALARTAGPAPAWLGTLR